MKNLGVITVINLGTLGKYARHFMVDHRIGKRNLEEKTEPSKQQMKNLRATDQLRDVSVHEETVRTSI